jgi:hypothetical protein
VQFGGQFTSTTGLELEHWGWSILMGVGSFPMGIIMRFVPVKEDPESFANFYAPSTSKLGEKQVWSPPLVGASR